MVKTMVSCRFSLKAIKILVSAKNAVQGLAFAGPRAFVCRSGKESVASEDI